MSRFRFELAGPADDADLRRILAATSMAGQLRLVFRREPSYFDAAVVEGRFRQVVAARDLDTGRLVGFGARAISRRFVNGQPDDVGYLSSLRLLPEYRGSTLIARGYAFFRRLHSDGRARLYLTTIAEDNQQALTTLARGRGGLPRYHPWGSYHTIVVPLRRPHGREANQRLAKQHEARPPDTCRWDANQHEANDQANSGQHPEQDFVDVTRDISKQGGRNADDCEVRSARPDDLPRLLEFLATTGRQRQFFGLYSAEDFQSTAGMFRDLELGNLLLATHGDQIVGCLGGWDQSAFRQSVVESYGSALRWTRPLYNVWAAARNWPRLPRPGERLRYWTGALPLVSDDRPEVFSRLLTTARSHLYRGPGDYLLMGLHERDPLLPLVRRCGTIEYTTRLFVVCWADGEAELEALDDRPPYLELGQL